VLIAGSARRKDSDKISFGHQAIEADSADGGELVERQAPIWGRAGGCGSSSRSAAARAGVAVLDERDLARVEAGQLGPRRLGSRTNGVSRSLGRRSPGPPDSDLAEIRRLSQRG
jgi:hypothetical protein